MSKIRDQIEEILKTQGHYVYGYLRNKDSLTAPRGSLYYVGIANNAQRPFKRHIRGNEETTEHDVPVPEDEKSITILGSFSTREETIQEEIRLISQFGRKDIDQAGILLNRTNGGEGVVGLVHSDEMLERMRGDEWTQRLLDAHERRTAATAEGFGIPLEQWNQLNRQTKGRVYFRFQNGIKDVNELIAPATDYAEQASNDYGIPKDVYESLSKEELWLVRSRFQIGYRGSDLLLGIEDGIRISVALSAKLMEVDPKRLDAFDNSIRSTIKRRFNRGVRGEELFKHLGEGDLARSRRTAERLGLSFEQWEELDRKQRNAVRGRYSQGYRGSLDLLEGIKEGLTIAVVKSSRKIGVPTRIYAQLDLKERETVRKRHARGVRGPDLLSHLHGSGTKALEAASKYGLKVDVYAALSKNQKFNLAQRYRRGKRGNELLEGFEIPSQSGEVDT
jgi:hypothetical protein